MSSQISARAAFGVFLALCSGKVFREAEPFALAYNNLLAVVAQDTICLTFGAALAIDVGLSRNLDGKVFGVILVAVNICVVTLAVGLAARRSRLELKEKRKRAMYTAKKVEWAIEFSAEKFDTTLDAVVDNAVPRSSVLVFWYGTRAEAATALRSGLHAVVLRELDYGRSSGIPFTFNRPLRTDDTDSLYFASFEAVLACSIPRYLLFEVPSAAPGSSISVLPGRALQALISLMEGGVDDLAPWIKGGVILPPRAIVRAYLLSEQSEMSGLGEGTFAVPEPLKDTFRDRALSTRRARSSTTGLQAMMGSLGDSPGRSTVNVERPESCLSFTNAMAEIRARCDASGLAVVYHYTMPFLAPTIAETGFRMSTQGQGDGGVYFSVQGPATYGLGSLGYEDNIIVDCFGASRLEEYRSKGKLDLVIVYGADTSVLTLAPGGRDNARMVSKGTFEALTLPNVDGNYFLRPDRIMGMFLLDKVPPGLAAAELKLEGERRNDKGTKAMLEREKHDAELREARVGALGQRPAMPIEGLEVAVGETSPPKKKKRAFSIVGSSGPAQSGDIELGSVYPSSRPHDEIKTVEQAGLTELQPDGQDMGVEVDQERAEQKRLSLEFYRMPHAVMGQLQQERRRTSAEVYRLSTHITDL